MQWQGKPGEHDKGQDLFTIECSQKVFDCRDAITPAQLIDQNFRPSQLNANYLGASVEIPLTGNEHILNSFCNHRGSWFQVIRL